MSRYDLTLADILSNEIFRFDGPARLGALKAEDAFNYIEDLVNKSGHHDLQDVFRQEKRSWESANVMSGAVAESMPDPLEGVPELQPTLKVRRCPVDDRDQSFTLALPSLLYRQPKAEKIKMKALQLYMDLKPSCPSVSTVCVPSSYRSLGNGNATTNLATTTPKWSPGKDSSKNLLTTPLCSRSREKWLNYVTPMSTLA